MGFLPELNKAVILVPKTGTKTIQKVCEAAGTVECDDHQPRDVLEAYVSRTHPAMAPETQYAANVRHPVDRLLSAIHYSFKNPHPRFTLSFLMDKIARGDAPSLMFKPQSDWLGNADSLHLFRFDTMDICRWLGWKDEYIPKLNPSDYRFTRQQLEAEPLFNTLMDRYEADWQLWDRVI